MQNKIVKQKISSNVNLRPNPIQIKYCLIECGAGNYYTLYEVEEIKEILKVYRPSRQGIAFSLCRAICRVKNYWTQEEFDTLLKYVEDGLYEYEYDKKMGELRFQDLL